MMTGDTTPTIFWRLYPDMKVERWSPATIKWVPSNAKAHHFPEAIYEEVTEAQAKQHIPLAFPK